MALDALFLSALIKELNAAVAGCVIDKVQQPARDTVLFTLRGAGGRKLLVNTGSGSARVCLTSVPSDNPPEPPMFCMLLRKHLVGARIQSVTQPNNDRICEISLICRDALGVESNKRLIAELMGRNSNLILTEADGHIIDCMRRVAGGSEVLRPVLPGLMYHYPEEREGVDILSAQREDILELIISAPADVMPATWLSRVFRGLSPLICREAVWRACGDIDTLPDDRVEREKLAEVLIQIVDAVQNAPCPSLLRSPEGSLRDFYALDIRHYGVGYTTENYEDLSLMLDEFFARRDTEARMQAAARELYRAVKTARDRVQRRLVQQRREFDDTENRDTLRENGDIITANLYGMKKGMKVLRAEDFYSETPGTEREIPLDPLKTPQQNAAKYYKDYNRAKTARRVLTEQLEKGENELNYLESVLDELSRAGTLRELSSIRRELEESGLIKNSGGKKKLQPEKGGPWRFESPSGFEILVGRNNIENDRLTLKTARKNDYWLHVKELHGSHVVISCLGTEPDEETVMMAAGLAAWYSEARNSGRTPVDITYAGNVKKPSGALPGRVIYTDYHTVYVLPDEKAASQAK